MVCDSVAFMLFILLTDDGSWAQMTVFTGRRDLTG
jgi:hypothetical protein